MMGNRDEGLCLGQFSQRRGVGSGVSQQLVLELVLFNLFIRDVELGLSSIQIIQDGESRL